MSNWGRAASYGLMAGFLVLAAACGASDSESSAEFDPGATGSYGGEVNQGVGGGGHTTGDASAAAGAAGSSPGAGGAAGSASGQGGASGAAGTANNGMDGGLADSMVPSDAAPPSDEAGLGDAAPDAEDAAPELPDVDVCAYLDSTKPLVMYQSADDSNSMGSPVIARRLIQANQNVPRTILRTYEFLNYYNVQYDFAPQGHVRVVPQMRPGKQPGEYFLQVGIQSEQAASPRRPMNLTFVLDNTGSMMGTPLALEKTAVKTIAAQMKVGDIVSMLAFNTTQWVLLDNHLVTGPNDPAVLNAANQLIADGSTDLHAGLVMAYDMAAKSYDKARMNRVVLISDGIANVGVVDANLIANASHNADGEGIYLVGVGVGDGLNDTLMNTVTDKGRGAYVYLDTDAEGQKVFSTRFDEVMEVALRDVRLELTVPWYFTMQSTSAEQTSTNPEEVDPQYLAPNDAIVLHDTFIPCGPTQFNPADLIQARVTYKRPFTGQPGEDMVTNTMGELLSGNATQLKKGTAIVAYAEALKQVDGLSGNAATQPLDEALAAANEADPADPDIIEIKALLTKYRNKF